MPELSMNAAQALRDYAAKMPLAIQPLQDSCQDLLNLCRSKEDSLGPRAQDYVRLILAVKTFLSNATEPILVLAQKMNERADWIEHYLAQSANPT